MMGWKWVALGLVLLVPTEVWAAPTLFWTVGPRLTAGATLKEGPFVAPGLEFTLVHFDRHNYTASPWQAGFVNVDTTTDGRGRIMVGGRAGISFCGLEAGGFVQWAPEAGDWDGGLVLGPMCSAGLVSAGLRLVTPFGVGPEPPLYGTEFGLVLGLRLPEGIDGHLNWALPPRHRW